MADDQVESVAAEKPVPRRIDWSATVLVTIGSLLVFAGGSRFFLRQQFGSMDALRCGLWLIPALLLVLLFDYTLHHARLVAVMPLLIAVVLALTSPAFDIAIGLALIGTVALPALNERRERQRAKLHIEP